MRKLDEITGEILAAAYRIHTGMGPGLLESVYEAVLAKLLTERGFDVERQKIVPIVFEGLHFDEGFRVDMLVDGRVVVELKSVEKVAPVHATQLLTYLRLMDARVGLLINFGAPTLKQAVTRVVNLYVPGA
jgi:iron complex transport system substrate-binding protein